MTDREKLVEIVCQAMQKGNCAAYCPVSPCMDVETVVDELTSHGVMVKEPQKPMTVDELYSLCGSGCHCIYVEHRNFAIGDDSNAITPNIGNRSRTGYRIIHYNGYQYNFCWCDYGKTWRCWAEKPTEEERKAAEWES